MKTDISCIIPTCDRAPLLIEAIQSVLNQTVLPHEILIINNGKASVVLPEDVQNKVTIFNIIPFAGVSQARNYGAIQAKGSYLAFLDDDDLWSKNYIENVITALDEGAKCVVSRLDQLDNGKISFYKNAHDNMSVNNLLSFNPGVTGSNIVIEKGLFYSVRGYDPLLPTSEDKSLIIDVMLAGGDVVTLSDNQAIHRVHSVKGRLTNAKRMAEGIYAFTRKYSQLMGLKIYLYNLFKINSYRYKAGQYLYFLPYVILGILVKLRVI